MAKKKGEGKKKGGKKLKEAAPKVYEFLCGSDLEAREIAYINHLADLRACLNIIYEAEDDVKLRVQEEEKQKKWELYITCDILPKPYSPPATRLFFFKLRFFENLTVKRTIDWQLSIDERSILTQDIDRVDYTRKTLRRDLRSRIGDEYDENINFALKVLKLIDYYLDDETSLDKASPRVLLDIVDQQSQVHEEINEYFDRYAYRVVSAESSYLDSIDGQTCEHFYKGTNFQIHIWALKNVPILFEYLPEPFIIADFHALNAQIQIPFSVLESNLTIRGLHLNFDHFSQHAKSFSQNITPPENISFGVTDLYECLIKEWKMHFDLQTKIRNQLVAARQEYQEKVAALEEEAGKKKQNRNAPKQEGKKAKTPNIKLPKEPPIVQPGCVPDVLDDFLAAEEKGYKEFLKTTYHPDVHKLQPDELNLKKYFILGGIYQFYFVQKPANYTFSTFNMTWHLSNGNLVIRNNVYVQNTNVRISSPSLTFNRRPTQSKLDVTTETNVPFREQSEYSDSPLFTLTFKLPETMCKWGEPLACHFEADVIGIVEILKENLATLNSSHQQQPNEPQTKNYPQQQQQQEHQEEENQMEIDANEEGDIIGDGPFGMESLLKMSSFAERSTSQIFRPQISSLAMSRLSVENNPVFIEDFNLDLPFTKPQIRNLQRHCVPRVLSSFKFPKEIKQELMEEAKPKGKSTGLMRHKSEYDEFNDVDFEQGEQNNPERLFPLYPQIECVNSLEEYPLKRANEPETFFELINTFDAIKKNNLTKNLKIVNLPFYTQNIVKGLKIHHASAGLRDTFSSKHTLSRKTSLKRRISMKKPKMPSVIAFKPEHLTKPLVEETEYEKENEEDAGSKNFSTSSVSSEDEIETYKYSHWTTQHIFSSSFDRDNRTITICTDRLGTIGFAYKLYEHFPFQTWSLRPSAENPEDEIIFTLDTQYVRVVLKVTKDGYSGYVTDITTGFVRNPVMYLTINKPINDLRELKKRFRDKNLNIFSGHDAYFYIENGYFSEKHLATELHTYCCMAANASTFKFMHSIWNRLAKRRDIILRFAQLKDKEMDENIVEAHLTPENATFVEVTELCSDNLDEFKLKYMLTWRNLASYADLHHLILSIFPAAVDVRVKDAKLICYLKNLLSEVRPLSFS